MNSYTRLDSILRLRNNLSAPDWWKLLGEYWVCCDNIANYKDKLRNILIRSNPRNRQAMMNELEWASLQSLPQDFTVYRGCYDHNRDGLSWSLSKDVASGFPLLNRYKHEDKIPILLTGIVNRDFVVLKLEREEQEVICSYVKVVGEQTLGSVPR